MRFLFVFVGFSILGKVFSNDFLTQINNFNKVIKDPSIELSYTNSIENIIEMYLKRLCYNPKFKHINQVYLKQSCYYRLSKNNCILYNPTNDLNSLIYIFKRVVKKYDLPVNKKLVRDMNKYLSNVCVRNFNINQCIIKKNLYKKSLCIFNLSCNHLNKNNNIIKKNIKLITKINKLNKLDYCKGKIRQNCNKICFNPSDCTENELDVPNYCDYRYYYTCVLFNGNYLPELNYFMKK